LQTSIDILQAHALGKHLTQFLPHGWLQTLHQKLAFAVSCESLLQKNCHYNVPQKVVNIIFKADGATQYFEDIRNEV
jgi:hypothetical protein